MRFPLVGVFLANLTHEACIASSIRARPPFRFFSGLDQLRPARPSVGFGVAIKLTVGDRLQSRLALVGRRRSLELQIRKADYAVPIRVGGEDRVELEASVTRFRDQLMEAVATNEPGRNGGL